MDQPLLSDARTAAAPNPESMDQLPDIQPSVAVDQAIASRRSVRAFLPTPVPREVIENVLRVASRAPSGTNTQPWRVYVLTGNAREALSRDIVEAFDQPDWQELYKDEYDYYPSKWKSPFIDRRRKIGWDLYALLGIGKQDKQRMHEQHARNYSFFGAPVGLMFTIDRVLGRGSWMDYGMFLENIMIAARGRGLDTCPQAAFTHFHAIITRHLDIPPEEMVVCGMALGYADQDALVNRLVTERAPVSEFTTFVD